MELADSMRLVLIVILPLWLLAGLADWLCHRASHIERTSGSREALLHLFLYLEIAIPVAALAFLGVSPPLLVLLGIGVLAHFVTSWVDTAVSQPRRHITALEQLIHSGLEMLPLFALVLLVLLQAHGMNLSDHGGAWIITIALLAGLAFIVEEYWRCQRYSKVRPAN